jgi:hypothetical protein
MRTNLNSLLILILIAVFGILLSSCQFNTTKSVDWQDQFQQQLPLLGHRNWVLVVDKAFPLQSAQGMTVINTGEQLPEVLVLKTESTIPYSSVFIQLDCKYWSAEKEQKLRSKMQE